MSTRVEVVEHCENGEKNLYQWDLGRKIKIATDKTIDEVHFSNVFSKQALVVKPQISEELEIFVPIPNILLQTFMVIDAYVVCRENDGRYTSSHHKLDVIKRNKPSDYVYTETEIYDYRKLEERVAELEKGGVGGGISEKDVREIVSESTSGLAAERYVDTKVKEHDTSIEAHTDLRKKIEFASKTAESAKSGFDSLGAWAKEPKKPAYTAAEVGAMPESTKIPSKTSELENDSGFLTEHQDLSGYAKKATTLEGYGIADGAKKSDIPSVEGLATENYVNQKVSGLEKTEDVDKKLGYYAKKSEIPTTSEDIGAEANGTADTKVSEHNVSESAHNDIRLLLKNLTTKVTALLDSDDETLNQTSEIVAYIKTNKSLIDAITTSKVSVDDIIDNLTTNLADKPLSAKQGVVLKGLIDDVRTALNKIAIPTTLPNPNKLIFAGAVSAEYDGSGAVTVNIPEAYTPQKGVDYWTDADQEDIVQQVITALGTPVFGTVNDGNVITLSGELAEGIYTIKYEDSSGNTTDIGEITVGASSTYTNQIPISTDSNGSVYNDVGYLEQKRINSSGAEADLDNTDASNPTFITGFIPVQTGDIIRLKNCYMSTVDNIEIWGEGLWGIRSGLYDSSKSKVAVFSWGELYSGETSVVSDYTAVDKMVTEFKIAYSGVSYLRVTLAATNGAANAILTVNEDIE